MKLNGWIAILALAAAFGCTPKAEDNGNKGNETTPVTKGGDSSDDQAVELPDKLNHMGLRYAGLNGVERLYDVVNLIGGTPEVGSEIASITSAQDDVAIFSITRAGGLANLGSETHEVRTDGIYLIEMMNNELEEPMLLFPAEPKVGESWEGSFNVTIKGQEINCKNVVSKFEALETITCALGEVEAMRVSSVGNFEITAGTNVTEKVVSADLWYVLDHGMVKLNMTADEKDGETITTTMDLILEESGGE
jgi:hypothetical protein